MAALGTSSVKRTRRKHRKRNRSMWVSPLLPTLAMRARARARALSIRSRTRWLILLQDAEAHKASSPSSPPAPASVPAPPSHTPQYVRSGRGGAGNFAEPPTVADSLDRQDVVDRTTAAVSTSLAGQPRSGLSGRGGAGNWTDDGGANKTGDANEEQTKQQRIADQVAQDISASLATPPKAYHQHDREME